MIKHLLLLSIVMFCSLLSYSQDFSNKGKEFWLVFPAHTPSSGQAQMGLFLTSDQNSSGTITVNGFSTTFTVTANQVTGPIDIPYANANVLTTNTVVNKGIHVLTNAGQPAVVLYAHIYAGFRSEASLILPVNTLGKDYYSTNFYQRSTSGSQSQFNIVATEANTVVTYQLRTNGVLSATVNTVNLPNPGDEIQVQNGSDLSGSVIHSIASGTGGCKKIAVFSGSSALAIGSAACTNPGSYDPLYQQCYPVSAWGKNFGVVPLLNNPSGFHVRVMAAEDNTTVNFNGTVITLNAGQFYPASNINPTAFTVPMTISADKSISVSQYLMSANCSGSTNFPGQTNAQGDPDMVILNPVEQNISDINIFSSNLQNIRTKYLNVYMKTVGSGTFRINGAIPTGTFTPMPQGNGYSYLRENLSTYPTNSFRLKADSGFNAITYGMGDAESYAYSAGTNVKDLFQQISVSTQYGIETSPSVCTNSPFKFRISLPYQPLQLIWDLSGLPATTNPNNANVTQDPSPTCPTTITNVCYDSTTFVNGKQIWWYSLPLYYSIPTIGSYPIVLTAATANSDGCGTSQEINFNLDVSDPPVAAFTHTTPGCVAETVNFSDASVTVKPNYHWYWDFGDPGSGALNNSNAQFPSHLYTTPGNKTVRFASITTPGCLSDTISQTFYVPPQPSATIAGTVTVCQNDPAPQITFTGVDGTAPYIYSYHINSGAIQTVLSTAGPLNVPTATPGTYVYTLDSVKNATGSALCNTRITGQTATVTVNPTTTLTLTSAAATSAQTLCINNAITNITYAVGGSGTGAGVTGLPAGVNGSYSAGVFTISGTPTASGTFNYTVSTTGGSCGTPSLTGTITVTPNATLTLNSASSTATQTVCKNTAISDIVFAVGGSATNASATGLPAGVTGIFTAGIFTISGTPTVSGVFNINVTTSGGCLTASLPASITVNPLPTATIAGTVSVCQNGTPTNITFTGANATAPYTFTYTITGPGGTGPTLSVTTTAGNSVTVAAPTGTQGVYTYTLTGVTDGSSTLCANTAAGTATVTVNQLPTATISGTTELCLNFPAPNITFTGAGGTAPYTFTYTINSGGNQTVTTTAGNSVTVAAPTSTAGTFIYSLVSVRESSPTTCLNNQVGTATVIVDPKPTASFTTSVPQCEAKDVTFTPAFSVSTGSVVSWIWDYGDGTGTHTRTDGLPFIVNYAIPGPKNVTFQTVSDKGCLSAVFAQTVTINPKPHAGFISPEICLLDPFAQFTDTSSVAAPGTITGWQWNFGDPNATPANPNTSTAQNPTHIYTQVGPYTVQLTVTTNAGCVDMISQGIYISDGNPQAKYNVLNPATLCSNDSVGIINKSTITSGNITKLEIYWDYTNQPGVFDTENNPVFDEILKHKYPTLTTAQNYKIHMRAYSGGVCFSSKDTIITVHAAPVAQLTAIPNVCLNNGTVQFTQGSETGGVPGTGVYSGAGVSATGLFDPLVAGVGSHTITYTWTSAFGCVDFKTTNVNVLEAPVAVFAPAPVTCQNSSITFTQTSTSTAGVIVTWIWHWGDGSADETYANGNPRTHTYTTAGPVTATLTVITDYGCKSLATPVTFTVNPQPHPNFTYTPVACLPQAKIDFTNTTPNISDWVYQWNFDDVNASSNNPNTSTAINHPMHTYTTLAPHNVNLVALSPGTSCTHDTTISIVSIHPAPTASFTTNKQSICTDQTILVTDHSNPADGVFTNWAWDYGDLTAHTTGQVQQPHVYADAGTFIINLTVTNSFGCTDDTTASIRVYPYPVIDAGPDQTVLQGGFITLKATATGNLLTYLWTPGTYLNSTTILQPTVNPYEDITYHLKVTAEGGCFRTDTVFVKVLKTPLIPNTFTPNGDGIHDTWEIKYLYQYPGNRVQVFTRTGQLVFESHGYSKPWDGTKEGKPLPFDTYYYIIEPVNGRAPITGYVTIVK